MSLSNVVNANAFLRTTREFPSEGDKLRVELNRTYVDIANIVNFRTIGLFPVNRPAQNGESWFLTMNQRQQGFRQVYAFSSFTSPLIIPHGISFTGISQFTRIYGTAFDNTYYYPLPFVDIVAANQIIIKVDATNINVIAGPSAPVIVSGLIILEWISDP